MRSVALIAVVLLASFGAQAEVRIEQRFTHSGMCEASGAVPFPEGSFGRSFIVVNDNDNVLRAYAANRDGPPLPMSGSKLAPHLDLGDDDDPKADFEGATWLGGKVYIIGSHSRSRSGRLREPRWQFLALDIAAPGSDLRVRPTRSSHKLAGAFAAHDPILENALRLDLAKEPALAAKAGGLDIEGLTVHADGRSMLIGLRGPLSPDGKAILVPLLNPQAVAEDGADPALGPLIRLDLGGRGVRSIEYSPGAKAYFIIAGAVDSRPDFALYRWSGDPSQAPRAIAGFKQAFAGVRAFQPEGLFVDPAGRRLHVFSDDGQLGRNGIKCESFPENEQAFRSFVISVD